MSSNVWKLQDAKAQFSKLVRQARAGEPQIVTVRGEEAVIVSAAKKRTKKEPPSDLTMAGFIERSKKYRGLGLKIPPRTRMKVRFDPLFDEEEA
jgi:antitoxin Phd